MQCPLAARRSSLPLLALTALFACTGCSGPREDGGLVDGVRADAGPVVDAGSTGEPPDGGPAGDAGVPSCEAGTRLETSGCVDIDECAEGTPCGSGQCVNFSGAYVCLCPLGFVASDDGRACLDVDECLDRNGGCAQRCLNEDGGASCACGAGWTLGADGRSCDDVDDCATANGGCAQACVNEPGSFRCACSAGWSLAADGRACDDVDECTLDGGGCSPDAQCINQPGSRDCRCQAGTCGDGFTCVDERLCNPPTGLEATPGDAQVRLQWSGSGFPGPVTWRVKRSLQPAGPWALMGSTAATSFIDTTVSNGVTAWYTVSTVSAVGESPDGVPVSVTPVPAPAAPTAVVATSGDGEAMLSWVPGTAAARTRVFRATSATGPWLVIGSSTSDRYTDQALTNGTRVWYALVSENVVGQSAPTPPVEVMPLAPPQGLVVVAGDGQVSLFWRPSLGALSYEVQRAPSAQGTFAAVATAPRPRFTDSALANGVAQAWRVVAVSDVGRSAPSAAVVATPAAGAEPLPPPEDPTRNRVGLNTWFNTDWDGSRAFVDVFKSSRRWQDATDWNRPVAGTDALGWPTADASTVLFSGEPADFNGTYKLVFTGQATVSTMWCPGSVANQVYDPATNTTRAEVTFAMTSAGSVGLVFRNTRRTPTSPLGSGFSHARLHRPGYPDDGSVTFTAPFLAALGRAEVVRMMEWALGGSNVVQRWEDRVTPLHATQGGLRAPPYTAPDGTVYTTELGVALEHQVELCNRLMVDCWVTVPPVVDDVYVRNMALVLRFGSDGTNPYTAPQANPVFKPLAPSLRLYVEYGNENWNSGPGFLSFQIIRAIAGHLAPTHPAMVPAPDSIWTVVWRYPAWRTAEISDLFRSVFGDAAMMTRVRPVLMTQVGNAQGTLSAALTWLDRYAASRSPARRVRDFIYAAGGSGYYGVNNAISALPDVFFAPGNFPDTSALRQFAIDSLWAANAGVKHVAYEGGPGLSYSAGDNRALNADPRMQTLVEASHAAWSQQGGDLLVYYNLRGPSEWEFTPHLATVNTPKLNALDAITAAPRAAVTLGGALPGPLVARDLSATMIRTGFGYDYTVDGFPCAAGFATGDFVAYPGHAPAGYSGQLVVRGHSGPGTRLGVWINGEYQGEATLAASPSVYRLSDSTAVPVRVPAGLAVVRLEVLSGNLTLYSITL